MRKKSPVICIAGMHRSGTSMVTGLLKHCGLELGDEANLIPPSYANEAGYWEDRRFVELNERVLAVFGGTWDVVPESPEGDAELWRKGGSLSALTKEAKGLLASWPSDRPSGWKDPRNSVTLPFWLAVAPSLKIVVCVRNPLEVALSLQRIGAVRSNADGLKLWQIYNEHVMRSAPPEQRIITHASQYFTDPVHELSKVAQFAGLNVSDRVVRRALKTIRPDLRHSQFCDCELGDFGADAELIDLYNHMCEEANWSQSECRRVRTRPSREVRDVMRQPAKTKAALVVSDADRDQHMKAVDESAEQMRAPIAVARKEFDAVLNAKDRELEAAREQILLLEDEMRAAHYDSQELIGDSSDPESLAYRREIRRIREVVRTEVPRAATVAVVSAGDPELLLLYGRRACHYPQNENGSYLEHQPTTSLSAIAHLEFVRAQGADFLLVPATELWWLDQYQGFDRYLRRRYRLVVKDEDVCLMFDLRDPEAHSAASAWRELDSALTACETDSAREVAVLDWNTGLDLAGHFPDRHILSPLGVGERLPYLDSSIDLVVISEPDVPARIAEARRVASVAVVGCQSDESAPPQVEWKAHPHAALPTFSLVIVGHQSQRATPICLPTLRATVPRDVDGEILVVGNDDPNGALLSWSRVDSRVNAVQTQPDRSFTDLCNWIAADAKGEILIFVDPQAILLQGWLQPLLKVFSTYRDAGVAGGKLLSPDGRLRHAGGVVFADGVVAGIGDGDFQVQAPLYSFVRVVDCCSLAMLATKRSLFTDVGGFRDDWPPGSHLSADYSWRVRGREHRSYFQPESVAVVLNNGDNSNLETRLAFAEKWRSRLASQPERPGSIERSFWYTLPLSDNAAATVES